MDDVFQIRRTKKSTESIHSIYQWHLKWHLNHVWMILKIRKNPQVQNPSSPYHPSTIPHYSPTILLWLGTYQQVDFTGKYATYGAADTWLLG